MSWKDNSGISNETSFLVRLRMNGAMSMFNSSRRSLATLYYYLLTYTFHENITLFTAIGQHDRANIGLIEIIIRDKKARRNEVKNTVNIIQIILYGCTRENNTMITLNRAYSFMKL